MAQQKEDPGARDGATGADRVSQDCGGPDVGKVTLSGFDPQASRDGKYQPSEIADLALGARRTVWRQYAGRTIPNRGRLASVVVLTEDGERLPIFMARGTFRLILGGRGYRLSHLSDAEAIAIGWLLHSER